MAVTPTERPLLPPAPTITAHEIKEHLDIKVIGQESAKIQLSVLLSMHLSWFTHQQRMHRSPNAILMGPTGVGKTHTLRVASEFLGLPFVAIDTTALVPSGIVGIQIEDIIQDLIREADVILRRSGRQRTANDDIDLARRGIVFLDEFDKIAHTADRSAESNNLAVQRRLLKFTDGAVMGERVRKHATDAPRTIDTTGILFLAGGAFVGIDDNRVRTKRPAELVRILVNPNATISADIVNFGFMPELVARLPILVEYQPLTEMDLRRILDTIGISPLGVWFDHFEQLGKALTVAEPAREYLVRRALALKMGARGLHQVIFPALARLAYKLEVSEDTSIVVSVNDVAESTQR